MTDDNHTEESDPKRERETGSDGDVGTGGNGGGDSEATSGGESAEEEIWFERLDDWRDRLEPSQSVEQREEIIDTIEEIEEGMVEKGFLDPEERGDYSAVPEGQERQTTEGDDSPDDGAAAVTDERGRGTSPETTAANRTAADETGESNTDEETAPTDRQPETERLDASGESNDDTDGDVGTESADDRTGSVSDRSMSGDGTDSGRQDKPSAESVSSSRPTNEEPTADASSANPEEEPESGTADASREDADAGDENSEINVTREEFDVLSEDVAELTRRMDEMKKLFEEFKRANEHEHDEIRRHAVEDFARDMLRVRDTLQRATELFDMDPDDASRLEAVVAQFDQQFTLRNIDPIEPDPGTELDFGRHEVVESKGTHGYGKDEIARVSRRGFELSGRVIRPAQVVTGQKSEE